ncbi:MAG: rod shape-determining protein MreC [Planctomycetes bacterium]|nr:rod shape-determining protein MreC [Planctomycetota bacterium]
MSKRLSDELYSAHRRLPITVRQGYHDFLVWSDPPHMNYRTVLNKERLLAGLMLASITMSLAGRPVAEPMRRFARLLTIPLADAGVYVTTALKSYGDTGSGVPVSPDRARQLARENDDLRRQLDLLAVELRQSRRRNAEIQGIRSRFFAPADDLPIELIPARVVMLDSLPYSASRVVSAAQAGRMAPGQAVTTRRILIGRSKALPEKLAVVTVSSLVGRLSETDAYSARLQLITDRKFGLSVSIRRVADRNNPRKIIDERDVSERILGDEGFTDVEAFAQGDGAGGMTARLVQAHHGVRRGDMVFTSAGDGWTGGGRIPVGTVDSVEADGAKPGLFVTVHIKPRAHLAALRDVYIIVPPSFSSPRAEGD